MRLRLTTHRRVQCIEARVGREVVQGEEFEVPDVMGEWMLRRFATCVARVQEVRDLPQAPTENTMLAGAEVLK